jgi:hypothetical protein
MAPQPPWQVPHRPWPHAGHGAVSAPPPRSARKAVTALLLGLFSVTCLGALAGIPAIVVGSLARKDIDRSGGRLTGSGMAAFGIVSGLFGTGLSLVLALMMLGGVVSAAKGADDDEPVAAATQTVGAVDVVDLDRRRPLHAQLVGIAQAEAAKGRTVVLQTYVRSSKECAEVAAALPDTRMQRALANVTLVRVDLEVFTPELRAMRVDVTSAPWFYKLDGAARPTDAISAGEWDENVPENMAPVLERFVQGTLGRRRSPKPL